MKIQCVRCASLLWLHGIPSLPFTFSFTQRVPALPVLAEVGVPRQLNLNLNATLLTDLFSIQMYSENSIKISKPLAETTTRSEWRRKPQKSRTRKDERESHTLI